MQIREYSLPNGWYPRSPDDVKSEIESCLAGFDAERGKSRACVSPHAGWYYCARLIARSFSALVPDAVTIVILGGHLSAGYPPLFAMENAVRTPLGAMPIDSNLRSVLFKELKGEEDRFRDNTVEVLLPMAHYFFPQARLLWLRLPAEIESYDAGQKISEAAADLNLKINVIASTDLTHYGRNYGFSPRGSGREALKWVREVNDANFIHAVESGDSREVLRSAEQDSSACSVGAVLGAMGFAHAQNLGSMRLLDYATSADVQGDTEPDSFVGYASLVTSV